MVGMTGVKMSVYAIRAWTLMALGMLVAVPGARAQTSTTVEMISITEASGTYVLAIC